MSPDAKESLIVVVVSLAMIAVVTGEVSLLKAAIGNGPMGSDFAAGAVVIGYVLIVAGNAFVWWWAIQRLRRRFAP